MTARTTPVPYASPADEERDGWPQWLLSTDHKRIGILTIGTSLVLFFFNGAIALTMRAQLAQPGQDILSPQSYLQFMTMHGSVMIAVTITPLALGLGVYLVPLQIGAPRIAAPRATLLGYWLYVAGAIMLIWGFLTPEGASVFVDNVPAGSTPLAQPLLVDLGTRRIRRHVVVEPQRAGRDDARTVDLTLLDVIAQRDVAFRRAAAGEHRRVSRLEKILHLLLLVRPGVDVAMGVDEARQRGHAFRVDRLQPLRIRGALPRRHDLSAADDDRPRRNHGAVADDDARVRDGDVLRALSERKRVEGGAFGQQAESH